MKFTVYGMYDDILVVKDASGEEHSFDVDGTTAFVAFSNGVLIQANHLGRWDIVPVTGKNHVTLTSHNPDGLDLSDVVGVDDPSIEWVIVGVDGHICHLITPPGMSDGIG